jgi:sugar lactone lactonase YvrE
VLAVLMWWLVRPGIVDAAAWTPPPPPALSGPTAINQSLKGAILVGQGLVWGPEDVAVDAQGKIYAGTQDGLIVRIHPDGGAETWARTGGRPLGLDWDPSGQLIVADAYKGLLSLDANGTVTVLSTGVDGQAFGFTDDVDVASDGKIYFTDASSKFGQADYALDLLELRPHGSLLMYDPDTGRTSKLLDQLYFANGVALSADESFLLVNETWKYRILRYWLKGDRAGQQEVFIDNLPGFPDGVSGNGQGTFWVALPSPRKADVDAMHGKPWLKNAVAKLPKWMRPKAVEYGLVLALNEQGRILASYHDPEGKHLREITSVEEHDGYIYLGSLGNDRIGKLKLDQP